MPTDAAAELGLRQAAADALRQTAATLPGLAEAVAVATAAAPGLRYVLGLTVLDVDRAISGMLRCLGAPPPAPDRPGMEVNRDLIVTISQDAQALARLQRDLARPHRGWPVPDVVARALAATSNAWMDVENLERRVPVGEDARPLWDAAARQVGLGLWFIAARTRVAASKLEAAANAKLFSQLGDARQALRLLDGADEGSAVGPVH